MYAVIKTGGKQYRVETGTQVRVESLALEVGSSISFARCPRRQRRLGQVGAPFVSGAQVKATVVSQGRGEKVRIFKMRRRKTTRNRRASAGLYRVRIDAMCRGRKWHTRKQAAARATAATRSPSGWA